MLQGTSGRGQEGSLLPHGVALHNFLAFGIPVGIGHSRRQDTRLDRPVTVSGYGKCYVLTRGVGQDS